MRSPMCSPAFRLGLRPSNGRKSTILILAEGDVTAIFDGFEMSGLGIGTDDGCGAHILRFYGVIYSPKRDVNLATGGRNAKR